jgi:hypothetical protein
MLFALLTLLMSGFAAQDGLPHLSPKPLKASASKKLEVPSYGTFGQAQCDDNSSMYDHLATGSYRTTVILRTSFSGTESTLYELPDEFAQSTAFTDFSVTPDGSVTALVENEQGHSVRFDFDGDGKVTSHSELELTEQVKGDNIAVFPNGTLLFSGHYRSTAPPNLKGKRYLGIFQASGKLLRRLGPPGVSDIKLDQAPSHIPEGGATIGRDGNVYLLTPDEVLVISASGAIQKRISFTKPAPEFSAVALQYSEGLIAISFVKQGKTEAIFQYLVMNASNGEPLGLYEPTEETGNNNVCFSRREGFVFVIVRNDRLNMVTAPLR